MTVLHRKDGAVLALLAWTCLPGAPAVHGQQAVEVTAPASAAERAGTLAAAGRTAAVAQPATQPGICGRTQQVVSEILRASRVAKCADVTARHLAPIISLGLSTKQISALKKGDFSGLVGAGWIDLGSNSLTALPSGLFTDTRLLIYLYLQNNLLTSLDENAFASNPNIETLYAASNRLTTLPADVFAGLKKLDRLHIQDNRFTTLPADVFDGLTKLSHLHLDSGSLPELPDGLFSGLSNLRSLWLQGHPGAPFALELELASSSVPGAASTVPGNISVALPLGAPFPMRIGLAADGGTLSADAAGLGRGATESAPVVLTHSSNDPALVSIAAPPPVPTHQCWPERPRGHYRLRPCYQGLATRAGPPLAVCSASRCPADLSFGAATWKTAGGASVTVTVTLSETFGKKVVVPVEATSSAAGTSRFSVADSVTFAAGENVASLTVSAAASGDDAETLTLAFGNLPWLVKRAHPTATATVSIDDDAAAQSLSPTVRIASDAPYPAIGPFKVTFTFSESVLDFEASDVKVANGAGSNFQGSGASWSLTVTPSDGQVDVVTVRLPAGAARNAAGSRSAAQSASFAINTLRIVTGLAVTSDPGTDGTYGPGDRIRIAAALSYKAKVTGAPQLSLTVGSGVRSAVYQGGDGTASLTFEYAVAAGDLDVDGISVAAGRIALNGGTIANEVDNAFDLNHPALPVQADHRVDAVTPTVQVTSAAALPVIGPFTVNVRFSESVSGLTAAGIAVANGAKSNFRGGGAAWSLTVTPSLGFDGDVTVRVPAGAARDVAGNGNPEATATFEADTTNLAEVTVLVAYTDRARAAAGGTTKMKDAIDLKVAAANTALTNSGVQARFRLVHAVEVDYDRTSHPLYDLYRLQRTTDRHLDGLHALRTRYRADLVSLLLRPGGSIGGAAFRMGNASVGFESEAFSVVIQGQPATTFAHELGHNMGLSHDRYVTDLSETFVHPYAFGYVNKEAFKTGAPASARWRTIMSYRNRCSDAGFGCALLNRFSNPDQSHLGDAIGVPASSTTTGVDGPADARKTLNAVRNVVASFRNLCTQGYTLAAPVQYVPLTGGTASFAVDSANDAGCTWEAAVAANSGFLTITSGRYRRGDGTVSVTVPASAAERTGTLTVAGLTATVRQVADPSPMVTGLALVSDPGADGTYGAGDRIRIAAALNHEAKVTGAPQVSLTVGSGVRSAVYQGGAGTTSLTFEYVVAAGDQDADGIGVAANRIALNGGAITNEANSAFDLSHAALPAQAGHLVDGVVPTVQVASSATTPVTGPFTVDVTFSKSVSGLTAADIAVANGWRSKFRGGNAAYSLTVTPNAGLEAAVTVRVPAGAAVDASGNGNTEATATFTADTRAPALSSAQADGSSLTLAFGEALDESSVPAAAAFTVRVGGAARSVTAVSVSGSEATLTLSPAVEAGDSAITVSYVAPSTSPIRDPAGNSAAGLNGEAVTNVTAWPLTDPSITSGDSLTVAENETAVARLAWSDPDTVDSVATWSIAGGADRSLFGLDSATGDLSFLAAPDHEQPLDAASTSPASGAGDNEYVVTVEVSTGTGARRGTAEKTLTVTVTDAAEPPETPAAPAVSGATASSLTASWTAPANTGPPIEGYDVQYRASGAADFEDAGPRAPALSATLSGLRAETEYEVRVRAVNAEGESGWSPSGRGGTSRAGGNGGGPGGGGGGGGGGGAPPPDDGDDGGAGGSGGGGGPPRAAISVDAECADGLCRALTGAPLRFEDRSTGAVRMRLWDFGDGRRSRSGSLSHAWTEPGFYRATLWTSDGGGESTAALTFLVEAAEPAGTCEAGSETRCLGDSRYTVAVDWRTADGASGPARVVRSGTNDAGLFAFFDPANWEVLVKVLDGCAVNGRVWVFAASTTDLGYTIRIADTATGAAREYRNEPGVPAPAITDVEAFAEGCR